MRPASSSAVARARSMSPGRSGTIGTTSVAPMRGCAPACVRRSMCSRARAMPASKASMSCCSSPTSVNTERLWSASLWTSSSFACLPRTEATASMTAGSRPSETFGTDSSGSCTASAYVGPTRCRRRGCARSPRRPRAERRRGACRVERLHPTQSPNAASSDANTARCRRARRRRVLAGRVVEERRSHVNRL